MTTRILGIDPGSQITGYGIIDTGNNHSMHIDNGIIRVQGKNIAEKLCLIYRGVTELVTRFEPQEMSIEKVFIHKNVDSALKLGQARGAAITAAANLDLAISEYTANQVKQATVGKGHAAKQQVQHMVRILLNLDEAPCADAADALAIALCHAHSRKSLLNLKNVTGIRHGRLQ